MVKNMYDFNEKILINQLTDLSNFAQIAFALSAAARQLNIYERYAQQFSEHNFERPREIALQLWEQVQLESEQRSWSSLLDEVIGLLPQESDDWTLLHALAEDALSSLAYSIRCLLAPSPRESAWSARRSYEAVDQLAIIELKLQTGLPETELAIKNHPIVQLELSRQNRDFVVLNQSKTKSINEMKKYIFAEDIATKEYLSQLIMLSKNSNALG